MRYFIEIAYNGTNYCGWQIQPNACTVQQELEQVLSKYLRNTIKITGAGRTDTGVHALQMFAHFDVNQEINDLKTFLYRINLMLPFDIALTNAFRVKDDAHARFDAISRSYVYKITRCKNPFKKNRAYWLRLPLDVDLMNEAANLLLQHSDFTSFSKLHTDVFTNNCEITEAYWQVLNDELHFHITANRFLRNMVRAIVGTLLLVGQKKISRSDFDEIIKQKNRSLAGASAPAQGLYLTKIKYPESIFNV